MDRWILNYVKSANDQARMKFGATSGPDQPFIKHVKERLGNLLGEESSEENG